MRLRYIDDFAVVDGLGSGTVNAYTVLDFNAGYRMPMAQQFKLSLSVQNLLDNKHREYISVPKIGRLSIVRLTYSL